MQYKICTERVSYKSLKFYKDIGQINPSIAGTGSETLVILLDLHLCSVILIDRYFGTTSEAARMQRKDIITTFF